MSTYQRNLMALASSLSFESPPVRSNSFKKQSRPEDSPFTDAYAIAGHRLKSPVMHNVKKDTIIGFTERYADMETEEPLPIKPLAIRVQSPRLPADSSDGQLRARLYIDRTSELPPTLELGMPSRSAAASMQDLENVLESFGTEKSLGSSSHEAIKTEIVSSSLSADLHDQTSHPSTSSTIEASSQAYNQASLLAGKHATSRASYRNKRPGAGVGALVNNVLSIHSTAGEVGEMSPLESKYTPSMTSSSLYAQMSGRSAMDWVQHGETDIPRSVTSRTLAVDAMDNRTALNIPFSDSRSSIGESLADRSKRASVLTTTTTGADLETLNGIMEHPFCLEEDANLARALSLSRVNKHAQRVSTEASQRRRASSVSHIQSARPSRSRTSTAYGGQMPATPQPDLAASRRSRTMTTDSEAVFALGSSMLAAFPDTPPTLPTYGRSPNLLLQPPSPSLSHDGPIASSKSENYNAALAADGFVPLSQMALKANGHDKHYRSPIDSIVGVFEYDDSQQ